jgi:hypothetical protein
MITQEILKKHLSYDEYSGIFTRLKTGKAAGTIKTNGYRAIYVQDKTYHAHRLAWLYIHGDFPKHQIDHINRNRDDNKPSNLREVTNSTNACNKEKPQGLNPYLGVTKKKRRDKYKWCARIRYDGKDKHIGYFDSAEDAKNAYLLAKAQYHNV